MTSHHHQQTTSFVLITGAWHPPSCFDLIATRLRDAGYPVVCRHHASVGADPPVPDIAPDVAIARQAIEEEADRGQDVVVFMHSYGGVVGTEACQGLAKAARTAAGKKGGVVKLIYCAAHLLQEGKSMRDTLPPPDPAWYAPSEDLLQLDIIPGKHHQTFYNDMTLEHAAQVAATLQPHSLRTFVSPITYAAWRAIPWVYVYCTLDGAILLAEQKMMVDAAVATGQAAPREEVTLEASHSPFLSMPDKVVEICVQAAEESGNV